MKKSAIRVIPTWFPRNKASETYHCQVILSKGVKSCPSLACSGHADWPSRKKSMVGLKFVGKPQWKPSCWLQIPITSETQKWWLCIYIYIFIITTYHHHLFEALNRDSVKSSASDDQVQQVPNYVQNLICLTASLKIQMLFPHPEKEIHIISYFLWDMNGHASHWHGLHKLSPPFGEVFGLWSKLWQTQRNHKNVLFRMLQNDGNKVKTFCRLKVWKFLQFVGPRGSFWARGQVLDPTGTGSNTLLTAQTIKKSYEKTTGQFQVL